MDNFMDNFMGNLSLDKKAIYEYSDSAFHSLDEEKQAILELATNLENRIEKLHSTLFRYQQERDGNEMAVKRCRVLIAKNDDGTPVHRSLQAPNQDALNDRIVKAYIDSGKIWEFIPQQIAPFTPSEEQQKRITLKAYTEKWLKLYHEKVDKPTTLKGYKSYLNSHIYPVFGSMQLGNITTDEIKQWLDTRVNKNTGKPLKKATLDKMLVFLGQILADAVEDKLIKANPADSRRLKNPSDEVSTREALTLEQIKDILSNVSKLQEDDRRLMALVLLTGCRRGEVLGSQWGDIDVAKGLMYIQRNVTYASNQPHIGTPKTEKGKRYVPLDPELLSLLEPIQETGYIIGGGDKPITSTVYRQQWKRISKAVDLYGATAHVFRHSYLTILASTGTDMKTMQSIAGHADIKTTMNRYVHPVTDNIVDAGNRVKKKLLTIQ